MWKKKNKIYLYTQVADRVPLYYEITIGRMEPRTRIKRSIIKSRRIQYIRFRFRGARERYVIKYIYNLT